MKTIKNIKQNIQKETVNLIIPSIIVTLFSALGFALSLAVNDLFSQIKKKYVKEDNMSANIIYIFILFFIIICSIIVLAYFKVTVKNPLIK